MAKFRILARQWDQITSKPHEPLVYVRHRKGAVVEIPKAEADRLLKAGAIEPPRRAQASAVAPPAAAPSAAQTPVEQQEPLAGDPDDDTTVLADAAGPLERPKRTATTEIWRAYGVASGLDADEVEDMGRDEIIAAFP